MCKLSSTTICCLPTVHHLSPPAVVAMPDLADDLTKLLSGADLDAQERGGVWRATLLEFFWQTKNDEQNWLRKPNTLN